MAKTPNKDAFTGRSGQLAVMAEFLIRETNVAIPEVDIGEDIVVVGDDRVRITPVQVKTANALEAQPEHSDKFRAQFRVPIKQLETSSDVSSSRHRAT